ncbi:MAG: NfeD family protein [Clostridia bacterium]|nr:NfeD family protein [Clostridia bacterium]
MWLYIWLAVTAAALIIEFITTEMVSVWFVGGGLVAMLLAGLGLDWYFHVPAFIVISLVLMLCFRKLVMKKLNKGTVRTNAETVIGKEVVLLSAIGFNNPGSIKVNGVVWTAVAEDENASIAEGTRVIVERIEGNKYIVKEIK